MLDLSNNKETPKLLVRTGLTNHAENYLSETILVNSDGEIFQ